MPAMLRSCARLALCLLLVPIAASCGADVAAPALALNDPLDAIDNVEGNLRLFVLPAETYACEEASGLVTPEVPDLPEGMFTEAVADVSLEIGAMTGTELDVVTGDYVILVRGKGTDPVSGRRDVFVASGCTRAAIMAGETREVRVRLEPIEDAGVCGDGVLSPDEQCEDGGTAPGDGCDASCRTEPFAVNTMTGGVQNNPSVGGAPGQRWITAFDSDNTATFVRLFEADGSVIETPSVLMNESDLDDVAPDVGAGTQLLSSVAVHSSGRIGIAFVDFAGGPSDVRVLFTGPNRAPEGNTALVVDGRATNPRIAFAGDGAAMVVYEDMDSSTGLSGQVFAPGAITPAMATPFEVGVSGGSAPAIAGTASGYVVAFVAGGQVQVQRFGADGSATDAPAPVAAGSMQSEPAVGALADGAHLVAWRQGGGDGDGAGSGIRAVAFDAAGEGGAPFIVNSTTAGDQGAPAIAAGNGAYAVAFTSGGAVRVRLLNDTGTERQNRLQPRTSDDFELAPAGTQPRLAAGGPGDTPHFLAVWNQGDDIFARLHPLP